MKMHKLYWFFAALRIVLIFAPQTGIVHPDEYLQSTEIIAQHVLKVDAEFSKDDFNVSQPIRGMALKVHLLSNTFKFWKFVHENLKEVFSPYMVLVAPRITTGLLSFLVDYSFYRICIRNNEPYQNRMVLLASSYVMYVYGIRTCTDTFQMICFSIILFYVADAIICTYTYLRLRLCLILIGQFGTPTQRRHYDELIPYLRTGDFRHCFLLATALIYGFFNDPKFGFYFLLPLFYWLIRGITSHDNNYTVILSRVVFLIMCTVPGLWFNIVYDSYFYSQGIKRKIVTPWYYLKKNIFAFRIRPDFRQLFINLFVAFNILSLVAFGWISLACTRLYRMQYHLLPSVPSVRGLMLATFLSSLIFQSLMNSHEVHYSLPLIIPLIYLYGNLIYPESYVMSRTSDKRKYALYLWIVVNLLTGGFYAFVNQAGVFGAMKFLHQSTATDHPTTHYFVMTSFTYPLPKSLALKFLTEDSVTGLYDARLHVFDIGPNPTNFNIMIEQVRQQAGRLKLSRPRVPMRHFYFTPSLITEKFGQPESDVWNMTMVKKIPMHFSYEAAQLTLDEYLSEIMELWREFLMEPEEYRKYFDMLLKGIFDLPDIFSLQIFQVDFQL